MLQRTNLLCSRSIKSSCKVSCYGQSRLHMNEASKITTRRFMISPYLRHGSEIDEDSSACVKVTWINKCNEAIMTDARVGMNLMRIAHRHGIELEGACEGVCACSTCHVILEEDVYKKLPEPSEEEDDMLDQAFGLTSTSRLGCQVIVTEEMDRMKIKLPLATRNFYVDGHVPVPH